MITSLIERLAKLIKNNPYNYQMVSIFATMVTLSALIAGCEAIKGTAIPTMPPTGEPGMTDDVTPTPSKTASPTSTSTLASSSTPKPTQTVEPTPTQKPVESILGLSEENRNKVVEIENDTGTMCLMVNQTEREFITKIMDFYKNQSGELTAKVYNLLDGGDMGIYHEDGLFEPNYEYFRKKFHDEKVTVNIIGKGSFNSLIDRLRARGINVSEAKANEMTGTQTLERIEMWVLEVFSKDLLPMYIETKMFHDTNSRISNINDEKTIASKDLFYALATHENGKIDITVVYTVDKGNKTEFNNLFDDFLVEDQNGNINQTFFKDSIDKSKVVSIIYASPLNFANSDYGKFIFEDIRDMNENTTVESIRESLEKLMRAHEANKENSVNYWYTEPVRTVNMERDYSKYSLKGILQNPGESQSMRENIKNGLYKLSDLYKQPITQDKLFAMLSNRKIDNYNRARILVKSGNSNENLDIA